MQKLAIVGASYLQLPLVLKAKEMGLFTICFAWEEGAVCKEYSDRFYPISILDKEAILERCREELINGITTIASDLAVVTVCYVADRLQLAGNTVESSFLCTNKYLQRNNLYHAGISVPRFENTKNLQEGSIGTTFKFPVVVKPVDRSGSKGVVVAESADRIDEAVAYAARESLCGEVIIEEFITGDEISVETISWQGEHTILAYTDKVTTGYPHFVELEHHQPSKFWNAGVHASIAATVSNALDSLGVKYGASHAELMISPSGTISVIEIGARMGGDFIGSTLVELSTGVDFLKAVIVVALGGKPAIQFSTQQHSGVCFYTSSTQWVAEFIQSKHTAIKDSHLNELNELAVAESSQRSGYFIYAGQNKIDKSFHRALQDQHGPLFNQY